MADDGKPKPWKVTVDGENAIDAALAILHGLKAGDEDQTGRRIPSNRRVLQIVIRGESDGE